MPDVALLNCAALKTCRSTLKLTGGFFPFTIISVKEAGMAVSYVDPLADNQDEVITEVNTPAIFLWAHNRKITYEYTGEQQDTKPYCNILPGSIIVDPWRKLQSDNGVEVVHYGNTRHQ